MPVAEHVSIGSATAVFFEPVAADSLVKPRVK
jgi:hypothetical protein